MALLAPLRASLFWVAALVLGTASEERPAPLPHLRGLAKSNPAAGVSGICGSFWPESLTERGYEYQDYAGDGATACVYLAKRGLDGVLVAVKVSKSKGMANLIAFKRECGDMHLLRLSACEKGKELLDLHEAFLPSCLDVDEADELPYIVMHAAPSGTMASVGRGIELTVQDQKAVFAQMIAAVFALHGIGMSHNDLHGNNIVLDANKIPTHLAVIDFGEVAPLSEAVIAAEKRDGNAIWRWTAVLASCGQEAQWENNADKMKAALPHLKQCLKDHWRPEDSLLDAIDALAQGDIEMDRDQRVEPIFRTSFVQENLHQLEPELKPRYHWSGSEGCLSWPEEKFHEVRDEAVFSGHFKCDTIPTFQEDPVKACSTHPSNAACFSIRPGAVWACGAGLDPKVPCITVPLPEGQGMYDGACLQPAHPAYKYALAWEGEAGEPVMPPSDKTSTTKPDKPVTPQPDESTTNEPEPAESSRSLDMLLWFFKAVAIIGTGALIWFLYHQAMQARNLQPRYGVEMNAR